MKKYLSGINISAHIWFTASMVFGLYWLIGTVLIGEGEYFWTALPAFVASVFGSIPVLFVMTLSLYFLNITRFNSHQKLVWFIWLCLLSTFPYAIIFCLINYEFNHSLLFQFKSMLTFTAIVGLLFGSLAIGIYSIRRKLYKFLAINITSFNFQTQQHTMETTTHVGLSDDQENQPTSGNKHMIKGLITGALILLMMIPTVFIINLVNEREQRQQEVAKEVSQKWSSAQTLTGPYLFVPYKVFLKDKDGKVIETIDHYWLLPENLHLNGDIEHQIRLRSIYKVLLYRTTLKEDGNFILQLPKSLDSGNVIWTDIKVCYGLSDFKGIEEKLVVNLNGMDIELSPGLPSNEIDSTGLSANVSLNAESVGKPIPFSLQLKLKGSGQLHFVPLSGNSKYSLKSSWPNPSFDGNNLPGDREVNDSGFTASWTFNKANLPFGTILKDFKFNQNAIAFGVTLLQPADQYAKTNRSVKYAILFIGLTFSLFYIVEIMQKKPVHPVQYVLIGLALVIFYTLLLAFSEFIMFDLAYGIASLATVLLISLYAWSHFQNWKSAGIFAGILSLLYGFIFILIRLEDTALLVGSIGLFLVLAIVMYASRKVNWYGSSSK
jgi:inner membrane protein